jgi:hypothetical protein
MNAPYNEMNAQEKKSYMEHQRSNLKEALLKKNFWLLGENVSMQDSLEKYEIDNDDFIVNLLSI